MSVPTLTNMATAPAMPPPAAFCAAFFKTSVNGFFSPSAACAPGASTHIQEEAASRRLRARTDGLMKTLCRVGPYTEPKPGNAMDACLMRARLPQANAWRIPATKARGVWAPRWISSQRATRETQTDS